MTTRLTDTGYELLDSGGATIYATVLPAAGAKRTSEVVSKEPGDFVGVECYYTGGAGATIGAAHIRVRGSSAASKPATTDPVWQDLGMSDGTITARQFAGAGANLGEVLLQATLLRTPPTAATLVSTTGAVMRAKGFKWIYVEVAEIGDTTNRGTLKIILTAIDDAG